MIAVKYLLVTSNFVVSEIASIFFTQYVCFSSARDYAIVNSPVLCLRPSLNTTLFNQLELFKRCGVLLPSLNTLLLLSFTKL